MPVAYSFELGLGQKTTLHFWHILKIKNLEIARYYRSFCSLKAAGQANLRDSEPNLNLSANFANLFLCEP